MTNIDFYILQTDSDEQQLHFVCRLLDKAVRQGNRILVHTKSETMTSSLDALLWHFKPESYVPHGAIKVAENPVDEPIAITHKADSQHHNDVLVNLSLELPQNFARFKRLAQVVNQSAPSLEASRQHFAFLKDRGYPIKVNKLPY